MVRKRSIRVHFSSTALLLPLVVTLILDIRPALGETQPQNSQSKTENQAEKQAETQASHQASQQAENKTEADAANKAPTNGAQSESQPLAESETEDPGSPLKLAVLKLQDNEAPMSERRAAARELIESASRGPEVISFLEPLLETDQAPLHVTPQSPFGVIAAVLAEDPVAPPMLLSTVARAVQQVKQESSAIQPDPAPAGENVAESLAVLLPALGSFRSRDAAELLVTHTGAAHPGAVRAVAFRALERLSGLTLEPTHDTWLAWLEQVRSLDDQAWRSYLFQNLARERDRVARSSSRTNTRLTELARQLNLLTPADQRSALLAGYMLDPNPTLRALGFELVERELRQSNRLNGDVADAAIALLAHTDASVRRGAARIIDQLAPPEAAPKIAEALERETDPSAAVSLLSASARWPNAGSAEAILKWLEAGGESFTAATNAAAELVRRGLMPEPLQPRVVAALRTHAIETLSDPGLALLAATGEDADRARIASLLASDTEGRRRAAARALLPRPDFLDRIIHAAQDHPDLIPIAAEGVIAHRPTAMGYASIAALLPTPRQPPAIALLERIAAAMSVSDRLEVARREDAALARRILAPLAETSFSPPAEQLEVYAEAMATLAEMRLDAFRIDAALAALARIPESALTPERLIRLRTRAMLLAGRVEEALATGVPAPVWLDALQQLLSDQAAEFAIDLAIAKAVHQAIEANFAASINEQTRARYDELAARLAERIKLAEAPPPEGAPTPPSEGGAENGGGGDAATNGSGGG